jgi:hypothetical protein
VRVLLERLRTTWNTLVDAPGANVDLRFGVLPPSLLTRLEAVAERTGEPLSHVCYDALREGASVLYEQHIMGTAAEGAKEATHGGR